MNNPIAAVTQVYFSPSGTTKKIVETFGIRAGATGQTLDLLRAPISHPVQFTADELVVVGMPVFAGRIPVVCGPMLQLLQGQQTPAVILAVYGNREYDDALVEMQDILTQNGFVVVGAGAFVARHSIFPQVATQRPDQQDLEQVAQFAGQCADKLSQQRQSWPLAQTAPGGRPYKPIAKLPLTPRGNSRCTGCGSCARICPTGAIDPARPRHTDKQRCITCTACVYACPVEARPFGGVLYRIASKGFVKKNSTPRQPQLFL